MELAVGGCSRMSGC